jgi:predicted TIM-barrel fold metal-dependent hydrolase
MLRCRLVAVLIAVSAGSLAHSVAKAQAPASGHRNAGFSESELRRFSGLEPIDTHTHIYKSNPAYFAMLRKLHMHTLDIVDVSDNGDPERRDWAKETEDVFGVVRDSKGMVAACATFDPYRIDQPDFIAVAIGQINESFERGAIAVKLWKNVGMEVKDSRGKYVLPDDPRLEPIYKDIAAHHKTLVAHVADPNTAWMPLNSNMPDADYFIDHPQWHMYKIPGSPSKEAILHARDHVLAMNTDLRLIGAHLGSMEGDLKDVAEHLDRYPNFAVDLAGRMSYLMAAPRAEAIAFITKYQDRLIYGTDDTIYPQEDVQKTVAHFEASYAADWRFLATDTMRKDHGHPIEGLLLDEGILRKIYHDNAVRWLPGIVEKRRAPAL